MARSGKAGRAAALDQDVRSALNAVPVTAPDLPRDHHHLYRCAECGLLVDRRNLGDVLYHEEEGHEPSGALIGLKFVDPMLATLADEPPAGDDWLHEIKYDGYRTQIIVDGGEIRAFTRNGHDWTDRYRPVLRAAGDIKCSSVILDGEMIVQDEQGRSDYGAFKSAMTRTPERLVFMAFDILHVDGRDVRSEPLIDRRQRLQELVGCHDPGCRIQFSEHIIGNGHALFEAADQMGLEGIVSKKLSSRYRSGRALSWLKVKCFAVEEFVVLGAQTGQGGPAMALLAREVDGDLQYVGSAALTLAGADRETFWRSVDDLAVDHPALRLQGSPKARWIEPSVRVQARYLKGSDKLRHATVQKLLG